MLLTLVAPRPLFHDPSGGRCTSSRVQVGQWLATLGVGVGAVLFTTAAQGAPNPLWPPAATLSSSALASSEYWPSDDAYGYGYVASTGYGDKPGQWWLYSFVPERSTNAVVLRQPKLAAGLSVDGAWRFTQGRPQVTLAFLDDGIDWSNPDLVDAIFLNVGELTQKPPTHADGSACAPLDSDPTVTDSPRVDCSIPPDHILSISDYRETLGWVGGATGKDPNGNGVLDPEDLSLLGYADKIDNDGNGFVDDIAGWDFVDSDNLPLLGTTTAGTEAALDAVARANNDFGRAGVCPNCRAIPVRVGHQRGASPQTLALGLLYASALGASAALVGHLPEGRVRVLDAALRSSAQRNMLTLLPRDGEQQRTPALRFDSNATRVIGTVTQLNGSTMSTASFLATDPCQTLDPGPILMAAAPVCSRRGPAVALGIAGLAASAARDDATLSRLSAFELGATLEQTTDRIAVVSSNSHDSVSSDSTDILRLNANSAVANISARRIPAEIDLESPRFYDTIALGSLSLSLPIVGRISALHADTFDLFVELAKGPPSPDANFTIVAPERTGLPATVPFGSGSTLATVDLRTWYHNLEKTSVLPEGSDTVATLRVRVVAHYDKTLSENATTVESEVQKQIVIVNDRSLIPGFPYKLEAAPSPPKLADLDGDGAREIIVGTLDGRLLALSVAAGAPVDSFKNAVLTRLLPNYQKLRGNDPASPPTPPPPMFAGSSPISLDLGTEPIVGPASIADLNGDGSPEIVFAGKTGRIYALAHDGTPLNGWPRCLHSDDKLDCISTETPTADQSASPVLADLDGDGRLEIVVPTKDGYLHALEIDGSNVTGWPFQQEATENLTANAFDSSPAVADMDGDQIDDLVLTTGEPRDPNRVDGSRVIIVLGAKPPKKPTVAAKWPVTVTSYDFLVDKQNRQCPAAAVDGETAVPRALLYGNATVPFFVPVETGGVASGSEVPRHAEPNQDDGAKGFSLVDKGADSTVPDRPILAPLFARPTLADLDRDGTTDVILPVTTAETLDALRSTTSSEHRSLLAFWSGKTGKMLPASPILLDDLVGTATPAVADLTNDGYPEMIFPSGSGTIVAYDACGRSPAGWPKVVGGTVSQSPAIGDINGDGKLEVVVVTDDGRVFAWRTEASNVSYVPWESVLHDNMNQSTHRFPTGTEPPFPGPLPVTSSGRCISLEPVQPESDTTNELSARGGCSCELLHRTKMTTLRQALGLFALGLAFTLRRQARRRRYSDVKRQT